MDDKEPVITFGDAPGNVITVEHATGLLRTLHAENPEYLGYLWMKGVLGVAPSNRHRRREQ